jgi:hypothetical protein
MKNLTEVTLSKVLFKPLETKTAIALGFET